MEYAFLYLTVSILLFTNCETMIKNKDAKVENEIDFVPAFTKAEINHNFVKS